MMRKSSVAFSQDLVIRGIVFGTLGYHNDGLLSAWDKKFEITNGTLNFIKIIKMTKELKIQDAVNNDNPITKKVMIKAKVFIFIVIIFYIVTVTR